MRFTFTYVSFPALAAAGAMLVGGAVSPLQAAVISNVNTASRVVQDSGVTGQDDDGNTSTLENNVQTFSFDAGSSAEAVVLGLTSESNLGTGDVSISYAGSSNTFTPAIDHSGSQPSIWSLNLGGTGYSGGSADLDVDLTAASTVNGLGLGIASVSTSNGLGIESHATGTSGGTGSGSESVSLTTTADSSYVLAAYRENSSSDNDIATADSPLTQIYNAQTGSSQGVAGYDEDVAAGTTTFSFTPDSTSNQRNTSAAAFTAVPTPGALPAGLALLGGMAMIRRRRKA